MISRAIVCEMKAIAYTVPLCIYYIIIGKKVDTPSVIILLLVATYRLKPCNCIYKNELLPTVTYIP